LRDSLALSLTTESSIISKIAIGIPTETIVALKKIAP
jgi:hypothetical protein